MELTLASLPYQVISVLLFFALSLQVLRTKKGTKSLSKCKLPPGPWTLPILGNLHNLASARLPHRTLLELARTYGPVMLLRTGQTDLVIITSREAAQEVMTKQDANFSERPMFFAAEASNSRSISFSNGPYWSRIRRIVVNDLLSSKRIKSLSSIRHEEVHSMLKWLATSSDKSPVTLVEKVREVANNIIARATFGRRCKDQEMFFKTWKEGTEQISWISLSDLFPTLNWLDVKRRRKYSKFFRNMDAIMEEMIQDHLKKSKQHQNDGDEKIEYNFIDVLMKAMENNNVDVPITFDGVKGILLEMLIGGTDTLSFAIEWAMTELVKHPKIMAKVQAEIRHIANEKVDFDDDDLMKLDYPKLVLKETMRLHPPVPLLVPRQCKETCELLGYSIPSGARVLINAWALGRDPENWSHADEFIPERFEGSSIDVKGHNFELLPFGAGRRICPGLEYAMTADQLILARLLLHFDWKLPDGVKPDDMDMTEELGVASHLKKPLSLIPVLRVPLPGV